MKKEQIEAWKRVRNAGTVSLIFGWLGIAGTVILVLLGIVFMAINTPIEGSTGDPAISSVVYGVMFVVLALIFVLPISIVQIVAGVKLRKPIARPKGWVIFVVVVGALSVTSLGGILELIFGVLALSTLHTIEGTEPPKQLS